MKEQLADYIKNLRYDVPSGLVVFLVALPLCLGIALASGAPLMSGLVTGIMGGLIVGLLSGSHLAVSGPAAGLTVIVLDGIESIGTFEGFLCAVIIAGAIQLVLGFLKAGIIGHYFPSSVIRGMLAAIGLILILKQIPHFLGIDQDFFGDYAFFQRDGRNTFTEIIYALQNVDPGPFVIGAISLAIIILWIQPFMQNNSIISAIPSALVVVVLGVILNSLFQQFAPNLVVSSKHLVQIPIINSLATMRQELYFPDFSVLASFNTYKVAGTIAIIASLETLLSVEATDKMDPEKRRTPHNRELRAQGVGNMVAGFLGGIPMTAVIVRSTANLTSGAKTKMSAFYHGVFLLGSVLIIPRVLNMIPLSALAAILLYIGYKLTKPVLYKQQWKLGFDQFVPFIVTIVAILFTDLLIGISIGLAVGIYFILVANYNSPFLFSTTKDRQGKTHHEIHLSEHVSFLNKASLATALDNVEPHSVVDIYGDNTRHIDYDVVETIYNFRNTAEERDIELSFINVPVSSSYGEAAREIGNATEKEKEGA